MRSAPAILCCALGGALVSGCVPLVAHQPTALSRPPPDETEIRAAIAAHPSGAAPYSLAVLASNVADDIDVETPASGLPGVQRTVRIPDHFFRSHDYQPVGGLVPDLRLHAAQNGANLLLLLDFRHEVESYPNGWYALGLLLIPLFAAPWVTEEIEGRLDWYLIDVSTGAYLARGTERSERTSRELTIYEAEGTEHVEDHERALVDRVIHDLHLVMSAWSAPAVVPPA
ncbi:MAG: hypothetical protein AB7S26_18255 [Sandaracinaceae bacterium]